MERAVEIHNPIVDELDYGPPGANLSLILVWLVLVLALHLIQMLLYQMSPERQRSLGFRAFSLVLKFFIKVAHDLLKDAVKKAVSAMAHRISRRLWSNIQLFLRQRLEILDGLVHNLPIEPDANHGPPGANLSLILVWLVLVLALHLIQMLLYQMSPERQRSLGFRAFSLVLKFFIKVAHDLLKDAVKKAVSAMAHRISRRLWSNIQLFLRQRLEILDGLVHNLPIEPDANHGPPGANLSLILVWLVLVLALHLIQMLLYQMFPERQ